MRKIFISLSKKNFDKLRNGEVIYKRLLNPELKNELFQIVTNRLTKKAVSKKVLENQFAQLKKENPNFTVHPILLIQEKVDHIQKYNYCWTVQPIETGFEIFILSEKSYDLYKKRGLDALVMFTGNISFPYVDGK